MRNNVNSLCPSTALLAVRAPSRVCPKFILARSSFLLTCALALCVETLPVQDALAQPVTTDEAVGIPTDPVSGEQMALDDLALAVVNEGKKLGTVKPEIKRLFEEVPGFEQLVAETTSRALSATDVAEDATSFANLQSFIAATFADSSEQLQQLQQLAEIVSKARAFAKAGDRDGLDQLEVTATTASQKAVVKRYLAAAEPAPTFEEAADDTPAPVSTDSPYEQVRKLARGEGGSPKERLVQFGKVLTLVSDGISEGELKREDWPFDDAAVRKAIHSLVGTNVTMQQRLVELYEDHIMYLVKQDDGEKLRIFYFAILELRPDPNELNNKLRLRIAFKASGDNARHFAIGRLDELKQARGISLLDRFRLVLKGYYGTAQPIVVLTMVCICAFAAFLKLFRWSGTVKESHDKYKRAKAFEEENLRQTEDFVKEKQRASRPLGGDQQRKRFREPQEEKFDDKRGPGYFRPVDSEDEYSRLLAFFELEDDATEGDIKAAYREMVKLHHPDRNPEGEKDQIEAFFQEIKEKYDRIMEVRGSWFGKGR